MHGLMYLITLLVPAYGFFAPHDVTPLLTSISFTLC